MWCICGEAPGISKSGLWCQKKKLTEGKLPPQIVDDFDSDSQMVEIWTNFLADIGWIKRNVTEKEGYTVTEKGQIWLTKLAAQKRASSKLLLSTA